MTHLGKKYQALKCLRRMMRLLWYLLMSYWSTQQRMTSLQVVKSFRYQMSAKLLMGHAWYLPITKSNILHLKNLLDLTGAPIQCVLMANVTKEESSLLSWHHQVRLSCHLARKIHRLWVALPLRHPSEQKIHPPLMNVLTSFSITRNGSD